MNFLKKKELKALMKMCFDKTMFSMLEAINFSNWAIYILSKTIWLEKRLKAKKN